MVGADESTELGMAAPGRSDCFKKWAKMGQPQPLFIYFRLLKQTLQIFQTNRYVKNVHPVYGAGIQTRDLWNMSFLP